MSFMNITKKTYASGKERQASRENGRIGGAENVLELTMLPIAAAGLRI